MKKEDISQERLESLRREVYLTILVDQALIKITTAFCRNHQLIREILGINLILKRARKFKNKANRTIKKASLNWILILHI